MEQKIEGGAGAILIHLIGEPSPMVAEDNCRIKTKKIQGKRTTSFQSNYLLSISSSLIYHLIDQGSIV